MVAEETGVMVVHDEYDKVLGGLGFSLTENTTRKTCDCNQVHIRFLPQQHMKGPQLTSCLVHGAIPSNTFALYGQGEDKELTELVPGILNQLGPDSLASLRKLAESYSSLQKEKGGEEGAAKDEDDDDIPDLVAGQNFDEDNKTPDVE